LLFRGLGRAFGEVNVCDAVSGKALLRFATRPGSAGLAYSPDGNRLVELGRAGASHLLRDASSGREILELTSAPDAGLTWAMAFSPDGSRLAGSSGDAKLRIWDVSAGRAKGGRAPDHILDGKITLMSQVAWSADGRRVSTSGYGGTVLTWQVASREPHIVVKGSEDSDNVTATIADASLRFAGGFEGPDGQTVLKVWDEAGKVLFTATDQGARPDTESYSTRRFALSRDGTRLAYSAWDSTHGKAQELARLRVWEIATGREIFRRDDEKGSVHNTTFSPDGRWLAMAWGVLSGPEKEQEHWVSIWDLETGKERLHRGVPYLAAVAFRPDGRRLASAVSAAPGRGDKGELRIWDTATGQVVLTHTLTHGYVSNLVYSADGTSLAVAVGAVGDAAVIKVLDAAVIKVLDADSGRERFSLAGHRNMIWKLAISPDGRRLASLASSPMRAPEVKLWDLSEGREMLTLQATGIDLVGSNLLGSSGFGFSPDGRRLFYIPVGNHRDAEVQVWDATPLPEDRADPQFNSARETGIGPGAASTTIRGQE
jgi:WD40 repeat protein